MTRTPEELVSFGSSFELPGQTVTLTPIPGPSLSLRRGTLALVDPWWPEMLPEYPLIVMGQGEQSTVLCTIDFLRDGKPEPVTIACAAAIGSVDQVSSWRPLVQDEAQFHLDSDSALGAFYDISDAEALRPLFEDGSHMQGVYNRALEEQIVTMEVDGRIAGVVFLCPDGSGTYPAYAGFDREMQAVAVLVDLRLLDQARD